MGTNTDAYLFFGMNLSEDWIPVEYEGSLDFGSKEELEDWEVVELLNEKINNLGVFLDSHCSCDYPRYFLSIGKHINNEEAFYASRGCPTKIDRLPNTIKWGEKIHQAANILNIPKENRNIGWWLASNWC